MHATGKIHMVIGWGWGAVIDERNFKSLKKKQYTYHLA